MEVTISLTVEASQSEIQELRLTADSTREMQSIIVKAFAEHELASAPASEVAEQQLVAVEVSRSTLGVRGRILLGSGSRKSYLLMPPQTHKRNPFVALSFFAVT